MNQLEKARKQINECDQKIAVLFEERMKAVEEVIAYKIKHQLPIYDANREKEVIEKNIQYIQDERLCCYYQDFMKEMMRISKEYQQKIAKEER